MTDDELREAVALYLEDQALTRRKKKFAGRLSDLQLKLGKAKAEAKAVRPTVYSDVARD